MMLCTKCNRSLHFFEKMKSPVKGVDVLMRYYVVGLSTALFIAGATLIGVGAATVLSTPMIIGGVICVAISVVVGLFANMR